MSFERKPTCMKIDVHEPRRGQQREISLQSCWCVALNRSRSRYPTDRRGEAGG